MAPVRLNIAKETLEWITERLGINAEVYAKSDLNFGKWLEGKSNPTLKQAQDFAKKFYVPFSYLFLKEEPQEQMPIVVFRKKAVDKVQSVNLKDAIFSVEEKMDWISEYLQSSGYDRLDYVGAMEGETKVDSLVAKIRSVLGLQSDWAFAFYTYDEAVRKLTECFEENGCFVIFNSVVGFNNSRPIDVDECRGFCLIDKYAPFVFVNSKDAKGAQIFTLIHEFCHLLLNYQSGYASIDSSIDEKEKICDKVAASFLVPSELLKQYWAKTHGDYNLLAKKFKVSRYVIARRAKDNRLISKDDMNELYKLWDKENNSMSPQKSSGGDFNRMALKKCSRTFLAHLNNALNTGKILHTDAYHLAGINGRTFNKLITTAF